MSTFYSRDAQWNKLYNNLVGGTPSQSSTTPTTNELVREAQARRFVNMMNSVAGGQNNTNTPATTTATNGGNTYGGNGLVLENGKVVYNPQNFSGQQYKPFSVADTLAQRAQGYQAQGLEGLANSYRTLNKENNIYNNTANKITDYYTALANDINSRENALAQRKESLANQLSQDIANQRQYVMDYFGPNGIFTNEINKYYDENGNYLASEAGRQMAMANAEGIQSGASLGAQRAARNEAYNNAFQNYLKVKEQELAAKMNISNQLISYMQALRQEYGDTQNTFVISQYQRANDLLNAISQSMAESQASIQQARLSQALRGAGTSSKTQMAIIAEAAEAVANGTATPEQKAITSYYNVGIKPVPIMVDGTEKEPYYIDGKRNSEVYGNDDNNVIPPVKYKQVQVGTKWEPDWDSWNPNGSNNADIKSISNGTGS